MFFLAAQFTLTHWGKMGHTVSAKMGHPLCHSQTHIHMCVRVCPCVCTSVHTHPRAHTHSPWSPIIIVVDILFTLSMANKKRDEVIGGEKMREETGNERTGEGKWEVTEREKREEEQGPERRGYKDKTGRKRKAKQLQSVAINTADVSRTVGPKYILLHNFNTKLSKTVIINQKNTWKRHIWYCIIVPSDLPKSGPNLADITLRDYLMSQPTTHSNAPFLKGPCYYI